MTMISSVSVMLLLFALSISKGAIASDDAVSLPMRVSCPAISSPGSNEVIQLVPKTLSAANLVLKRMPSMDGIKHIMACTKPACLSNPCVNGATCTDTANGYACLCNRSCQTGINCQDIFLKDCAEISQSGQKTSGVYKICPTSETEEQEPIDVYCNMEEDGDGWLVIQRRHDGTVNFFRNWTDYKNGFGDLETEFWLGNEHIHRITSQKPYKLRIDMVDLGGKPWQSFYNVFNLTDESDGYRLFVHFDSGNAGDALSNPHNGQQFTTLDRDNDQWIASNCANLFEAGWWFYSCFNSNLNGLWSHSVEYLANKGIRWNAGRYRVLRACTMEIRPVEIAEPHQ